MDYGWIGNVLHLDLTRRVVSTLTPDIELYHNWLGGRGLAGHYLNYYLQQNTKSTWDSPETPLLIFTGPLCGTVAPSASRTHVMSLSPLTGTVGDGSIGGRLGVSLKRAGWDGIIITGQADRLSGVSIVDEAVNFHEVGHLAGKPVSEVITAVKTKESVCLTTGPAADNACLFACISADGRYYAGRGGLGAVMGAKNLKYITVTGKRKVAVYDRAVLTEAREEILRLSAASPILQGELGLASFGTGALYDLMHARHMMPTRNFKATRFDAAPRMNAWHYKQEYGYKSTGCAGCHIQCKKNTDDGREIPEFETLSHFSALIDNSDKSLVVSANRLCGEYGLDTITAAATIACYQEIRGKNLSGEEILETIGDMAFSRKEGETLKLGSFRYAALNDHPESAICVKKQELAAYDPRGAYGMALA